jgi:hypothetical protein
MVQTGLAALLRASPPVAAGIRTTALACSAPASLWVPETGLGFMRRCGIRG